MDDLRTVSSIDGGNHNGEQVVSTKAVSATARYLTTTSGTAAVVAAASDTATATGTTTTDGGTVITLPTSNGNTFNVIASTEELMHFKPMICVNNGGGGYIATGNVIGDLTGDGKATHIVFQQATATDNGTSTTNSGAGSTEVTVIPESPERLAEGTVVITTNGLGSGGGQSQTTNPNWNEIMNMDVLSVRCKTTTAELYKNRLGSGGRGRCIKYRDNWYTPSEFEMECGRGSSKDWKRSIRYGGRSLQALIDEGVLMPHATSCTCAACCDDDATASGPVRLFTPYKRRRRHQTELDVTPPLPVPVSNVILAGPHGSSVAVTTTAVATASGASLVGGGVAKKKRVITVMGTGAGTEDESETDQLAISAKEEDPWGLTDHIDASSDYLDTQIADSVGGAPFLKLRSIYDQMTKLMTEFRSTMNEVRDAHAKQVEALIRDRDAMMAVRVQEIDEKAGTAGGVELNGMKKCANCNRDAMAECSLCRQTPYCSTFCQRKDWNAHQVKCCQDPLASPQNQQIMLLVDEAQ